MKKIHLDIIKTIHFDKYIVLGFSEEWLQANNGKPLEFDAELKEGKLVLAACLTDLAKTKEVDTNVM